MRQRIQRRSVSAAAVLARARGRRRLFRDGAIQPADGTDRRRRRVRHFGALDGPRGFHCWSASRRKTPLFLKVGELIGSGRPSEWLTARDRRADSGRAAHDLKIVLGLAGTGAAGDRDRGGLSRRVRTARPRPSGANRSNRSPSCSDRRDDKAVTRPRYGSSFVSTPATTGRSFTRPSLATKTNGRLGSAGAMKRGADRVPDSRDGAT